LSAWSVNLFVHATMEAQVVAEPVGGYDYGDFPVRERRYASSLPQPPFVYTTESPRPQIQQPEQFLPHPQQPAAVPGRVGLVIGTGESGSSSQPAGPQEPWWSAPSSAALAERSLSRAMAEVPAYSSRAATAPDEMQPVQRSYAISKQTKQGSFAAAPNLDAAPALTRTGIAGASRWFPDESQSIVSPGMQSAGASATTDRSRPSERLRDLLDSVALAEVQNEVLQEQNYRFRIRCLQFMREFNIRGLQRTAWNAWAVALSERRTDFQTQGMRSHYIQKLTPMLSRYFGAGPKVIAMNVFRSWRGGLEILRDENQLLSELEAHRNGRAQLIQQYRELEAEFLAERQREQESRGRLQEVTKTLDAAQQELAWASSNLQAQGREVDDLRSKVKASEGRVQDSQDQNGNLKRELRSQTERARRLELQLESEARDKQELHESLMSAERVAEGLRNEAARLEQEGANKEAIMQDKDAQVAALEAQLGEMHAVIHHSITSLTHGKRKIEAKAPMDSASVPLQVKRDPAAIATFGVGGTQSNQDVVRSEYIAQTKRLEDIKFNHEYAKDIQLSKEQQPFMY